MNLHHHEPHDLAHRDSVGAAAADVRRGHGRHAAPDSTAHLGHRDDDQHARHSVAMFRDRFWLSLALTIPILVWSRDLQEWLGYAAPTFAVSDFLRAALGTMVFVHGGLVFLRGAADELRARQPGMMS